MTNGAATAGNDRRTPRARAKHSTLPTFYVATGLALVYAGALAALLLGAG